MYEREHANLPFTICFCTVKDSNQVLMVYRNNRPNIHKWNGLGGKIENGENPDESIRREVFEEAEIDLPTETLHYCGIVTWIQLLEGDHIKGGMHAYIADVNQDFVFESRETREGLLEWKNIDWICDRNNIEVVDNIPLFLPSMLEKGNPVEYRCTYRGDTLEKVEIFKI